MTGTRIIYFLTAIKKKSRLKGGFTKSYNFTKITYPDINIIRLFSFFWG